MEEYLNVIVEVRMDDNSSLDYEKLRLDNIKRNADFLAAIGINEVRRIRTKPTAQVNERKRSIRKKREVESTLSLRRSTRLKSESPPELDLVNTVSDESEAAQWQEVLSTTFHGDGVASLLQGLAASRPLNAFPEESSPVSSLQLDGSGVMKVVKKRISALAVHPTPAADIVFAADHEGNVGIWKVAPPSCNDVASISPEPEEKEAVFLYKPHRGPISELYIPHNDSNLLYSSSNDGSIRCMDIDAGQFLNVYSSDTVIRDVAFPLNSPFSAISSCRELYAAEDGGFISLVDFRAPGLTNRAVTWSFAAHEKNIHCLQRHPTDEHILLSSTGGKFGVIAAHDMRRAGADWQPLLTLSDHTKPINGLRISPNGHYLVSLSQDDTMKVWTDFLNPDEHQVSSIYHYNNNDDSRRWLCTLLPAFDLKRPSTFAVGSMESPRRMEIFELPQSTPAKGESVVLEPPTLLMNDEWFTSAACRMCFHPSKDAIVGGNSAGKVFVFR